MGDHASYIATAISNAKDVHGIVEFEAGKVYRTSQVNVWRDSGGGDDTRYMIAGIEGNGAVLKWVEDGDVGSGQSLIYLWAPEFKGNTGFFIRNLTLDCGNNNIPTYNDRDDDDEGLNGDGSKGDLAYGDEACDYGLRLRAADLGWRRFSDRKRECSTGGEMGSLCPDKPVVCGSQRCFSTGDVALLSGFRLAVRKYSCITGDSDSEHHAGKLL